MISKRTARRKCREHEREWNGFCVDKNLKDEWLARLNDLQALELISICEGHSARQTGSSRRSPHIKLRLKDPLLPGVARHWDEHKMAILEKVNALFQTGSTYVHLELKFKLRSTTSRLNYEENLLVRIHARQPKVAKEMDPVTCDWFEQSVDRVEELDSLIALLF